MRGGGEGYPCGNETLTCPPTPQWADMMRDGGGRMVPAVRQASLTRCLQKVLGCTSIDAMTL